MFDDNKGFLEVLGEAAVFALSACFIIFIVAAVIIACYNL